MFFCIVHIFAQILLENVIISDFFFCVLYKLTVFFALTFRITHDCITDIQQHHKHRGPHPSISIPVPTPIIAST